MSVFLIKWLPTTEDGHDTYLRPASVSLSPFLVRCASETFISFAKVKRPTAMPSTVPISGKIVAAAFHRFKNLGIP